MKTQQLLDFEFLEDILYYDGPIISLGMTAKKEPVLLIWCDRNIEEYFNLYAYVYIREQDLNPFIHGLLSYYQMLSQASEIILFKYDGNKSFHFQILDNDSFIHQYGPQPNADLSSDLIDVKEKLISFQSQEIKTFL